MKGYLLDTNVLSALAPGKADKPPVDQSLVSWLKAHADVLFISGITVIEIEAGLLKLGRAAPGRRHDELSNWFANLLVQYADRVLPLDLRVARIASVITDRSKAGGHYPGLPDVAIAATAVGHDLTVLTRNLRHFRPLGVRSADPFVKLPGSP